LKEKATRQLNYYPHHIGDYLRDTAHLTALEDGIYRRMLDVCYASEKPLPLETQWVCRLVRATTQEEQDAVHQILGQFWIKRSDGWHNKRADEEITKAIKRIKTAKANGKRGGRKKTQQEPSGLKNDNPVGLQPSLAHQKPKAKSQIEKQDAASAAPPNGGSSVWDFGKSLLTEQGLSLQASGALIGSWLREWDEPTVADAIRSAAGKADVRSYVAAVLNAKPRKGAPVGPKFDA
jgi:uncharacterized protein YdaU (DUF1376 family)